MLIALYLVLCVLTGYWGRHTFAGPVGFFLISLMFTPVIGLIILLVGQRRKPLAEQDEE
ncbi:hypothetical protein HUZ36_06675 [Pseudoalteromonas sp. McH1-7]|uniref:Uncharacterized protein n=1 Tax=Pseudoalteromonas peptidolytica F12-50-A1 TaxID=1315280 RepID=A0A8I0T6G2_9GAMM|nr:MULTISPECIES: hypothetical protein [Pseudoalteromonas]MBE0347194.1 hypothetical protein [Pseudoalteromonas peptidolytica F12-50-A1]MDW7549328.1 hypothetical protein [Pseudoalteromonas peptidolytica]NUZ10460.1 hypothetical protein [Pseudoalteromonas sp. McH1-7]USD28987.1 hypothetical protein J8Z24_02495 [Pseudoalteromonas sp. SCSIO 43201]GEK09164.1 hypothetical protein PPE03_14130 [Pseudoalteromonas peptidolytica]